MPAVALSELLLCSSNEGAGRPASGGQFAKDGAGASAGRCLDLAGSGAAKRS